jgi:hypothetical protein
MLCPYHPVYRFAQLSLISFRKWSLGQSNPEPRFLGASG